MQHLGEFLDKQIKNDFTKLSTCEASGYASRDPQAPAYLPRVVGVLWWKIQTPRLLFI